MKAFIDINKSPCNDESDPEVRIRIKFETGREINITTTCSGISKAIMGCSEIPVDVSLRNVEVKINDFQSLHTRRTKQRGLPR